MPHALLPLLFFLSQPFWETKPPDQWTLDEIAAVRQSSPWVQSVGNDSPVLVYLATAAPIEQAENELRRRSRNALRLPDPEYTDFLQENRDKVFVLSISWPKPQELGTLAERKKLEDQSVLVVGRRQYKMVGHFLPIAADPVLRLVFPREVKPTDKSFTIRLYLPGMNFPEREVSFWTKDLMYRGKLEM
jgi:hypothetical protein